MERTSLAADLLAAAEVGRRVIRTLATAREEWKKAVGWPPRRVWLRIYCDGSAELMASTQTSCDHLQDVDLGLPGMLAPTK